MGYVKENIQKEMGGFIKLNGEVVYDDLPRRRNKNMQPRNYPNSARCSDGTSSKAGKGVCSRHGGVAK
ncbi:hypothetical protein BHC43_07575 [Snodgrassella alvi]|nr:hypothetical protein BHC43_07575 [Snodgrassella alvi]